MDNGLRGRYGVGLRLWNEARMIAADFVRAFAGGQAAILEAARRYADRFPSTFEIRKKLVEVMFVSPRDKIDVLARFIMGVIR